MTLLVYFLVHHMLLCSAASGQWSILLKTIGISAMHMQLLPNDRVIIFDRTDFKPSNILLPLGKCRSDPNDMALKRDCTAHSFEYDVSLNSIRPLMVLTDLWCSSGALGPDGSLVQTGGFNVEDHVVRVYKSCDKCDWKEINFGLLEKDGMLLVIYCKTAAKLLLANNVVKMYPKMPGGDPMNYPSTGSAVLLPMRVEQGVVEVVEVLVCGGAPKGAW
nr:hypothetical protein [Tanacetum cinerariifolium]